MNWHLLQIKDSFEMTDSTKSGLTDEIAAERLRVHGPNLLTEKKKKPAWLMFLLQFRDLMILILVAAAIVSGLVGDLKDTIIILVIVLLNAIVGFVQEFRAEKAMEALKKMGAPAARVIRNGRVREIHSSELVPGDLVLLDAGNMVPADCRLVELHSLKIDESALTGESVPVEKNTRDMQGEKIPVADRINMAFKGTLVTFGRGTGLVVATGMQTELGSIARLLQEEVVMTPLQKRMAIFGRKLSVAILIICLVIYVSGLLRNEDPIKMMLTAVSVAVAAIPEALPAVITIALALGAKKLVRKNALIRRLPAVETLGSVTYICSDKTGTLTKNEMTVSETWSRSLPGLHINGWSADELLRICMALNQDTVTDPEGNILGDPTEVALNRYAMQSHGYDEKLEKDLPRIHEIPFDSERKMMTTVHRLGHQYLVITKGALESILATDNKGENEEPRMKAEALAKNGIRVIAYGVKLINDDPAQMLQEDIENNLKIIGIAGLMDPPREEAARAVAECKKAGIVPVMITGDHPETAGNIARSIGIMELPADRLITGTQLSQMPDEEYQHDVENFRVYARVSPEQKLSIVRTLQKKNHFVAMTGDGVNDAPALKRANIGIAMGITGTDVTKESADMILLDDNFATIVNAVKEGRRIYDNIRKFIKYIMTGNSAEIWTIFLAPLIGLPIPLLPIHILWINLVTDGLPSLALAGEPEEKNIMNKPPRPPGESIFAEGLGYHILWVGLLMAATCVGVQAWSINESLADWQTMVFTVLCFSQLGHVLAIRSNTYLIFRHGIFSNRPLLGSVLLTFFLQMGIIYIPFLQDIFNTKPLTVEELIICMILSSIPFHAVETEKMIRNYIVKRKAKIKSHDFSR